MSVTKFRILSNIRKIPLIGRSNHHGPIKPFKDIPGPFSFPIFGTMLHYLLPIGHYDFNNLPETYVYMQKKFGDLVKEKCNMNRTIVHVFNPDDMYTVYMSDGQLPRRISHTALGKYRQSRPHLYNGQGLASSNGTEWYYIRNMFKRVLLNLETVEHMSDLIEEVSQDLVNAVVTQWDENQEINFSPLIFRWGIESILYINLNKRFGCLFPEGNEEAAGIIKAVDDTHVAVYFTENSPFHYKSNYKKLEKAQDFISSVVEKYITEFLKLEDWKSQNCLQSKLLQCPGAGIKDVFTVMVDMFLGGIDSTSSALSFALYNLAINKEAQDNLRKEVLMALPNKNSRMSDCKINTKYLKAVLNESMRLTPVSIGNGRILNQDVILSGYEVPANTMVILQHLVASQSEKYFKNAKSFLPERWLNGMKPSVASVPFGFGYRTCIGSMIAEKEILITLAKLLRNFEISYHYEPIGSKNMLINFPDKPLKLRLKKLSY